MVSRYDVEQIVRRMLASASAAVTAQQNGTVVSDGHRSFNFQGAGVVASDDPASRRVNVNIPGAPTASSAYTLLSAAGSGKALDLGTSGSPPAGFQSVGFNDTTWANTITDGVASGIAGADRVVYSGFVSPSDNEQWAFRQEFTPPAGTITSATIQVMADNALLGLWINNNLLPGSAPSGSIYPGTRTYTISPSLLTPGVANALAAFVKNEIVGTGNRSAIAFNLTINYTGAAADARYIPYSLIDAKGDLIAGTADNLATRLAVGADGLYLRAHSAAATGLDWSAAGIGTFIVEELDGAPAVTATALKMPNGTLTDNGDGTVTYTPAAAGSTLLFESVLGASAASISTGTLPTGHKGLRIVFDGRSDAATTDVTLGVQFNGDTAANYDSYGLLQRNAGSANIGGAGLTSAQVLDIPAATATTGHSGGGVITIPNYEGTTFHKAISAHGALRYASNTGSIYAVIASGFWRSTSAITSISFLPGSGNFVAGTSLRVYAEGS